MLPSHLEGKDMNPGDSNTQLASFDKFSAVYGSGFFIPNPKLLTALCLVFDQIHILNPQRFIYDYAMQHPSPYATGPEPFDTSRVKIRQNDMWVPFPLPPEQREAMANYMLECKRFWIKNASLHGAVIQTDMFTGQEPLPTQYGHIDPDDLRDPRALGEINFSIQTSNVDVKQLLNDMLARGAAPVFDNSSSVVSAAQHAPSTTRQVASLLALQASIMALPEVRPARPEVILEARERLRDHLPAFWSYMYQLSREFRTHIGEGMTLQEAQKECTDFIDTKITPVLLNTRQKMMREYSNWFYKIITPVADGIELAAGKSNLTWAGLTAILLKTLGNIVKNFTSDDNQSINAGLTFLIKLRAIKEP